MSSTSESQKITIATRSAHGSAQLLALLRRVGPPLLALALLGGLWLASAIAVPPALAPLSARMQGFVTVFLGIFIEALPFLMAGVLVSSAIALYISPDQIRRYSPRNPLLAALSGALLGLAFPVCECGSIPATRRLLSKGYALPAGIAFALAAPVINPVVLISTFVAFQSWEMVAWRAGLTILIAVVVGLLVGTPPARELVLAAGVAPGNRLTLDPELALLEGGGQHAHEHAAQGAGGGTLGQILSHATLEFFEMLRYLIVGALLAATLQTLVPQSALLALGDGPVISVLVMIGLAVLLSICSTVDSFIALSFVGTFTPGAVLAFLVFGPMIDIKSVLLLTTTFRIRAVALIALLCFQLALLAGVLVNLIGR
jgi:uncharacterized membrane protein YraQ (UPF0718 family)